MRIFKGLFNKAVSKRTESLIRRIFSIFIPQKSIRAKLIMAFLIPLILIIIQGLISYSNTTNMAVKLAKQSSVTAMETSGRYLDVVFRSISDQASKFSSNVDIKNYLSTTFTEEQTSEKVQLHNRVNFTFSSDSKYNPDVKQMMLLTNKKDISPLNTSVYMYDIEDAPFMKTLATSDSSVWFGYHAELDKLTNTKIEDYSFSMMSLLRNQQTKEALGLLVIDLKPEIVTNLVNSITLGKNQQIILVSPDGRVITNGKNDVKSDLIKQNFYSNIIKSKNISGSNNIKFHGIKYLMTYYKVGASGYMLLGMIPVSELNVAARQFILITVIIILLAVIIAFGVGYLIASSMSRTINGIIKASGKAASGDLSVTLTSNRKDELGIQTRSINSMIESMRSLIEQTSGFSEKVASSAAIVSSTSEQVSAMPRDVSCAIDEIAKGATLQADDAEQGAEKINILAENINYIIDNTKSIDLLTHDAMTMTQKGLVSVEDLDIKAHRTASISREIVADIKELDLHSKSIGDIVKVISTIANQSNLLALNASIEAARSGEAGKGFGVVAGEIQKLAEESMKSAQEIAKIIKSTQDQTAKTVEKASMTETILISQNEAVINTTNTFTGIMASMEKLSEQIQQIMSRVPEIETNKAQTINSIQNISAVSQETAASSEEVTASTEQQLTNIEELSRFADELKQASQELQSSISRFKLN